MPESVSKEDEMVAQEQNKRNPSRLPPILPLPLQQAQAAVFMAPDQLKPLPQAQRAPTKTPDQLKALPPAKEASSEAAPAVEKQEGMAEEAAKIKQEEKAAAAANKKMVGREEEQEDEEQKPREVVKQDDEEDDNENQLASQTPISDDLSIIIEENRTKDKNIDFSYTRPGKIKNIIGINFDYSTSYNVLEGTDNLGMTTSFYKILYKDNKNTNNITNILKNISGYELNIDIEDMLLTKIAEEKKADITHLFSIKLKTNNIKGKTNIFNYPSQSLNVEIYILLMNDNKIDFKNMYKNQNHITYLPCENLKYILFLGKFDTSEEWTKTDSSEKTIMKSLNFEKVLFIYSKHPTIPGRLPLITNKINLKQPINIVDYNTEFSKEVLFSLYNIDFITFTEEHFDKMIENKQHGGCCGVNNEIDDVVDSIEDVKDVKEDVKIGGDKVVKKKVKNKLPKKGKKSTKIADIES